MTVAVWVFIVVMLAFAVLCFGVVVERRREEKRLDLLPPDQAAAIRQERLERMTEIRAKAEARREAQAGRVPKPISQVGATDAGLACPKCKGTQFKARRSTTARAGIVATGVIGAAMTRRTWVQCVTCGTRYLRG